MPKERIEIAEAEAEFVRASIEQGHFANASEACTAGLRLLQDQMSNEKEKRDRLRKMLDDAKAGGVSERTFEEIWSDAVARHERKRA